jgi:hypothetical protein
MSSVDGPPEVVTGPSIAPKDDVALFNAEVRSLISGVTVASVAVPPETRESAMGNKSATIIKEGKCEIARTNLGQNGVGGLLQRHEDRLDISGAPCAFVECDILRGGGCCSEAEGEDEEAGREYS